MQAPHEEVLSGALQGTLVYPSEQPRPAVGVLVLAGSSGRVDVQRARLLADAGAIALALRWFGGQGQALGICEIPLERFIAAIDRLRAVGAEGIGIVGVSKGAEAALLVACRDARVTSVIAISPTPVVWANLGPGADGQAFPYRSSWTWRDEPLSFVPYDGAWTPVTADAGRVAYRTLYEQSLRAFPAAAAAIPVETTQARLLLVAGAADALWPSDTFAATLSERRRQAGCQVEVIAHPQAGHRPYFPGESAPEPSTRLAHGGAPAADAALGSAAWPRVLALLGLRR
jgi:hypothetical protein